MIACMTLVIIIKQNLQLANIGSLLVILDFNLGVEFNQVSCIATQEDCYYHPGYIDGVTTKGNLVI